MTRISALPTRDWRAECAPYQAALSAALKTPNGSQLLRMAQVGGLLELPTYRGLFINGRVGIGKTLALALAPLVARAERPLIVTLGGILKETKNHITSLREHWRLPSNTLFTSYTVISNLPRQDLDLRSFWHGLDPDFIGADEVDRLSNLGAACTQMIGEWRHRCPDAFFMPVTATCDVEGIVSYAHLMRWALGERSPLPLTAEDIEAWSEVVDKGEMQRANWVCHDLGIAKGSTLERIREAVRCRLHASPGVIIDDTPYTGVPLTIRTHVLDIGLAAEYTRLRELGQKADGIDVLPDDPDSEDNDEDGSEIDRVAGGQIAECAKQYGRGFFYKMDPLPPPVWALARRNYFAWVRWQLAHGCFMTEAQARAHAEKSGQRKWVTWKGIRDTFTPQYKTVWLSTLALDWAAQWALEHPRGVIWTEHTAIGPELERRTGLTYYGGRGYSAGGKYIEDAPAGQPIIASRRANSTGRNLQYKWNRMLFLQPLSKSRLAEQALGRVHREGLETWATEAHADVLVTCIEDVRSIGKSLDSGRRSEQTIYSQKVASTPWAHTHDFPESPAFDHHK